MPLKNITVILVESQGALNIGSVCRAMMNFGIRDLRLVNPGVDHLGLEAKKMALKASFLLEEADIFSSLSEALTDTQLTIGTTVRHGKYRKDYLVPEKASEFILERCHVNRVALVFGRENSGLTTRELDLCQHFITIQTDDGFSSMNLSHSVTVCLHEIRKCFLKNQFRVKEKKLAKGSELENLFQHMKQTLGNIEFIDPEHPDHMMRVFRRILGRADLDQREVNVVHGFMSKIDKIKNGKI